MKIEEANKVVVSQTLSLTRTLEYGILPDAAPRCLGPSHPDSNARCLAMTIPPLINLGGLSPVGAADCSMLPTIGPCLQPCTPERKGYYTRPCVSLSLLFAAPPPHLPLANEELQPSTSLPQAFLQKETTQSEGKQRPTWYTAERLQATGDGYYPRGTALRPPRRQALTPLARPRLGGGGGEKVCGPRRPTAAACACRHV